MVRRSDHNLRLQLMALADGELGSAQSAAVAERLADDPQAAAELVAHQQLRQQAQRVVRAATPTPPAALQERVAALAADPARVASSGWGARWLRPWSLAAGILLLAGGAGMGSWMLTGPVGGNVARSAPVPVAFTQQLTQVHVQCSRRLPSHTDAEPRRLRSLLTAMRADFGGSQAYPDLRAIGFEFMGAAPCSDRRGVAHLLYSSTAFDVTDTLSIFAEARHAGCPLQSDQIYPCSDEQSPHPVVAWRSEHVVYYVVGNEKQLVQQVIDTLKASCQPAGSK